MREGTSMPQQLASRVPRGRADSKTAFRRPGRAIDFFKQKGNTMKMAMISGNNAVTPDQANVSAPIADEQMSAGGSVGTAYRSCGRQRGLAR